MCRMRGDSPHPKVSEPPGYVSPYLRSRPRDMAVVLDRIYQRSLIDFGRYRGRADAERSVGNHKLAIQFDALADVAKARAVMAWML